jgi:D-alanine-D-alanine ligase
MRIALTYNLRRDDSEACAEFDGPETIETIVMILGGLGHEVEPIDVTGSISRLVARLRLYRPDLVLNLAEGERGAFREAFYPALFEQLGLRHTGSSASTLALCLDKALAKRVVAAAGVRVPSGTLVRDHRALPPVPLPALIKPNFEGASKGITSDSIVTTRRVLSARVRELLARYRDGVLVEEYIDGIDVAVGWVNGLGVLPAIEYAYPATGRFAIFDRTLKSARAELVEVQIPARVGPLIGERLADNAARAFDALGVRGYGRADFRVTPEGDAVFLEMNPLPSLAPREIDLYGATAAIGRTPHDLFAAILAV